jgi:hypothetical protein
MAALNRKIVWCSVTKILHTKGRSAADVKGVIVQLSATKILMLDADVNKKIVARM